MMEYPNAMLVYYPDGNLTETDQDLTWYEFSPKQDQIRSQISARSKLNQGYTALLVADFFVAFLFQKPLQCHKLSLLLPDFILPSGTG